MEEEGNPSAQRKKQKINDGDNPGGASSKTPPSGSIQNTTGNPLPNRLPEALKNGDMKTGERLKTDLKAKNNDDLVAEKQKLGSKVSTLTTEKETLVAEKNSLLVDLEDTRAQVAMRIHRVDKVTQLQFLDP
ncbi:putative chromosome-associated kinesin KIF4A-like [Sesbania bispinosa]|nr:putative chromosome-associated kinesin KIF4A-like [Sesbania bispinosa]